TQAYQVFRIESGTSVEIAAGRTGTSVEGIGGLRVWAGRALDPFYLDLRQLGAIDRLVQHGEDADMSAPADVANTFAGSSVNAIVLRVPLTDHQLFANRPIR